MLILYLSILTYISIEQTATGCYDNVGATMTILYKTDAHGKVLSIMVTNTSADKIESITPYHELRKTNNLVRYDDNGSFWVLFIPFDERYNIREEHMRKFYFHHCYNTKERKVILC